MWDLRNHSKAVAEIKCENSVEDFVTVGEGLVVANGNVLTVLGRDLEVQESFYPF